MSDVGNSLLGYFLGGIFPEHTPEGKRKLLEEEQERAIEEAEMAYFNSQQPNNLGFGQQRMEPRKRLVSSGQPMLASLRQPSQQQPIETDYLSAPNEFVDNQMMQDLNRQSQARSQQFEAEQADRLRQGLQQTTQEFNQEQAQEDQYNPLSPRIVQESAQARGLTPEQFSNLPSPLQVSYMQDLSDKRQRDADALRAERQENLYSRQASALAPGAGSLPRLGDDVVSGIDPPRINGDTGGGAPVLGMGEKTQSYESDPMYQVENRNVESRKASLNAAEQELNNFRSIPVNYMGLSPDQIQTLSQSRQTEIARLETNRRKASDNLIKAEGERNKVQADFIARERDLEEQRSEAAKGLYNDNKEVELIASENIRVMQQDANHAINTLSNPIAETADGQLKYLTDDDGNVLTVNYKDTDDTVVQLPIPQLLPGHLLSIGGWEKSVGEPGGWWQDLATGIPLVAKDFLGLEGQDLEATQEALLDIKNINDLLELVGFRTIKDRAGGIGSVTEAEWPKFRQIIKGLDPRMGPRKYAEELAKAMYILQKIEKSEVETYLKVSGDFLAQESNFSTNDEMASLYDVEETLKTYNKLVPKKQALTVNQWAAQMIKLSPLGRRRFNKAIINVASEPPRTELPPSSVPLAPGGFNVFPGLGR